MNIRKLRDLDPVVHLFLLVSIFFLLFLILVLTKRVRVLSDAIYNRPNAEREIVISKTEEVDESRVKKLISDAVASLAGVPKTVVQQITTDTRRTSFIPMGSMTTTTSRDWVDVKDSEVYVDINNDFSKDAYVTFETNLKVAHSNGQAFARLYDATNKIAVSGSEVSTIDNADFKSVSSGKLNLWSGNNLYKVQIKSLNGFEVTYSGGKIKISY